MLAERRRMTPTELRRIGERLYGQQNCRHLKDWLINDEDPSVSQELRYELEHRLSHSLSPYANLSICADLANRTYLKLKNA